MRSMLKLGAFSGSKNPKTVLSWLIENNAVVPWSKFFRSLSKLVSETCNDYVCSICHHGGDICCDRCPASFHATCFNIESIPEGDWFCPCCCCGICGDSQLDMAEHFADESLLHCHQCERQFHAHCKKDRGVVSGEEHWFFCKTCEMMQWCIQQLVGKPILVGHNLTCTLIKPMQYQTQDREDYDLAAMAENYSKLSAALEVMHECFDPVKDPKTKRDLVEDFFSAGECMEIRWLKCRLFVRVFSIVVLECVASWFTRLRRSD